MPRPIFKTRQGEGLRSDELGGPRAVELITKGEEEQRGEEGERREREEEQDPKPQTKQASRLHPSQGREK